MSELEDLRERVRCPICKLIFNKPKRLSSCSHVFCFSCIKRYMEEHVHQTSNFPPCPICRKPISTSLVNIDSLEPARAEEDIIPIVRKYETCNICNKKEHPKQKCFKCDSLICENCEPSHARYNPSHALGDVLGSEMSKSLASREICKQHPDEPVFYFCIMCESVLCRACQHATCKDVFLETSVRSRYEIGFLKSFKRRGGRPVSRVVLIKDIASEYRKWLDDIEPELNECIEFFEEYKRLLASTVKMNEPDLIERVQTLIDAIDVVLQSAQKLKGKAVKLKDVSTDTAVAKSSLKVEQDLLGVVRQRKRYSIETSPTSIQLESSISLIRQVSRCDTKAMNGRIADMLNLYTDADENEHGEILLTEKLMSFWIPKEPYTKQNGSFIRFTRWCQKNTQQKAFYDIVKFEDYESKEWDLYRSKFLERSSGPCIQNANVTTTEPSGNAFYTPAFGYHHYISHCEYGVNNSNMPCTRFSFDGIFGPFSQNKYTLCLSDILDLVCVFDTNGIRKASKYFPKTGIVSIIGNRENWSRLDTVFLYFDKHDAIAETSNGVHICARKARFKGVKYPSSKSKYNVQRIDERNGAFSFTCAKQAGVNYDDFSVGSYLCKGICGPKEISNTEVDFFVCQNSEGNIISNIPFKHFQVELLCSLKHGIYYVQNRSKDASFIVGKLVVIEKMVESKVLYKIVQNNVPIELSKLNPLTMVDGRNADIVLVCSVADNNETFVMIRVNKDEQATIEMLDLHDSCFKVNGGSVIDLEMDADGNIMFAIEDKNGQQHCGLTKYIM